MVKRVKGGRKNKDNFAKDANEIDKLENQEIYQNKETEANEEAICNVKMSEENEKGNNYCAEELSNNALSEDENADTELVDHTEKDKSEEKNGFKEKYSFFHNKITNIKESKIFKALSGLKPSKIKIPFKSHGQILNDEMFTTCESMEECARQVKLAEQVANEADQKVKKQKSKKGKILSATFLLLNIVCIVIMVWISASKEEGMVSIIEMFNVANLWYLLWAFLAFLLLMAFESLRYYILIWQSTRHSRPFLSYKVAAMGKYFDNITPLASGGQPMQIYYLKKRGIKASTASTMPFAVYIFNQFISVVVSVCVLIFSKKIAGGLDPTVFTMAIIGISVNFAIMLFVFTLSFSKKIGPIVVIWILKLLNKMHIIKDSTALFRKVMRFVNEYQKTFRYFVSNARNFIMMSLSTLCVTTTRYLIPAFVVCMFSGTGLTFETYSAVFIWCVLIEAVLSYIPWPGAGGVAEITYVTMFAYFSLSTGTTVWAMLIYRLFQYYIYLLQGLGILCYDFIWGNKKIDKTIEHFAKIDEERKKRNIENKKL